MRTQLKNSFFQVFTATTVWITFLLTAIFGKGQNVSINFFWNILAVAFIAALLFGVLYTALWNHLTLRPLWNVLFSSIANTLGGYLAILLLARPVFDMMLPWLGGVFALTLVLHTIAFYFYAKYENKQNAQELNKIVKAQ